MFKIPTRICFCISSRFFFPERSFPDINILLYGKLVLESYLLACIFNATYRNYAFQ